MTILIQSNAIGTPAAARPEPPPARWTFGIAAKLWLAFGAILVVQAAVIIVIWVINAEIHDDIRQISGRAAPTNNAAYEMEINAVEIGLAVVHYLKTPTPAVEARFAKNQEDFRQFHDLYTRSAMDAESRAAGQEVAALYETYVAIGARLMAAKNSEVESLPRVINATADLDAILHVTAATAEGPAAARRKEEVQTLIGTRTQALRALNAQTLVSYAPELLDKAHRALGELEAAANGLSDPFPVPALAAWERDVREKTLRMIAARRDLATALQEIGGLFGRFEDLRQQLDDILDNDIQARSEEQLRQLSDRAKQRIDLELNALIAFGIAAIFVAAFAAIYLRRRIVRPVRTLAAGIRSLTRGDLKQRVAVRSGDEIGALAGAFNYMAIRLEQFSGDHQARYRAIINHAEDGIMLIDESGDIIDVNPACLLLFGYAPDEVMGLHFSRLLAPPATGDSDGAQSGIGTGGGRELAAMPRHLVGRRKDGGAVRIALSVGDFEQRGEQVFVAILRDETQAQRTLRELNERSDALARSNADLERFASVASHDLQEPLRAVAGYCGLLRRRYAGKLDKDGQAMIDNAVAGAKRLQELTSDLLEYSRVGTRAGQPDNVDSDTALRQALANLHAAIGETQAVVTYDALPAVMTVRMELVQIFQNLIANAIKYRGPDPPRVTIAARQSADGWTFAVRDNGIGIDPQYHERVFRLFERLHTRDEYPGTGLGLALCKRIVERHGGRIWLDSRPGQGTTVSFTLPAAERMAA